MALCMLAVIFFVKLFWKSKKQLLNESVLQAIQVF